jgi:hypothetical protein
VPLAELPAHALEDSDRLEADAPVQCNAAVVRQRDARIGVAEALLSQEYGVFLNDTNAAAQIKAQYWDKLWLYSSRAAISGSETSNCYFK